MLIRASAEPQTQRLMLHRPRCPTDYTDEGSRRR